MISSWSWFHQGKSKGAFHFWPVKFPAEEFRSFRQSSDAHDQALSFSIGPSCIWSHDLDIVFVAKLRQSFWLWTIGGSTQSATSWWVLPTFQEWEDWSRSLYAVAQVFVQVSQRIMCFVAGELSCICVELRSQWGSKLRRLFGRSNTCEALKLAMLIWILEVVRLCGVQTSASNPFFDISFYFYYYWKLKVAWRLWDFLNTSEIPCSENSNSWSVFSLIINILILSLTSSPKRVQGLSQRLWQPNLWTLNFISKSCCQNVHEHGNTSQRKVSHCVQCLARTCFS